MLPFEITTTLLAPACLWRQLSFPSVSRSNPWPACFTVATRYPARTSSGMSRSISVVFPLFDRPTNVRIGTLTSALPQPGTQHLHAHGITGVQFFNLRRHINEAIGFHHGREDAGPLVAGR